MQMIPRRLFFEKRGRIKYISHLDTMRAFTRSLGRSGLPLWYTEGFNPHLYLTFTLPLALGCEGLRETVDIRLTLPVSEGDLVLNVNDKLPPGLRVIQAAEPVHKPADVAWSDYRLELMLQGQEGKLAEQMRAFCSEKEIMVVKKTKKGEQNLNIAPFSGLLEMEESADSVTVVVRLASGTQQNVSISLWLDAFWDFTGGTDFLARAQRVNMLCGDLTAFC